jgi:hypothetical protein
MMSFIFILDESLKNQERLVHQDCGNGKSCEYDRDDDSEIKQKLFESAQCPIVRCSVASAERATDAGAALLEKDANNEEQRDCYLYPREDMSKRIHGAKYARFEKRLQVGCPRNKALCRFPLLRRKTRHFD